LISVLSFFSLWKCQEQESNRTALYAYGIFAHWISCLGLGSTKRVLFSPTRLRIVRGLYFRSWLVAVLIWII
jgi:hypothetical protein